MQWLMMVIIDELTITWRESLSPRTAKTRSSNKESRSMVNAMITFLDGRVVRPSRKLGLQSTAENWQ